MIADDIPEEDKFLKRERKTPVGPLSIICVGSPNKRHEFSDLYHGSGISKDNPMICLQAFFCKFCLQIRIKAWDQSGYKIDDDFLERWV